MEKIIQIGDKELKLSNNMAWAMEYKDQFNKDPLESLMPVVTALTEATASVIRESGTEKIDLMDIANALEGRVFDITLPLTQLGLVDTVVNITWAMAKAADPNILPPKQWIRQFDEYPLDVIVPTVGELMLKGLSSSKNLGRLMSLIKGMTNQP